jgi:glycosyltransferase involved in cell wall biosynthesis
MIDILYIIKSIPRKATHALNKCRTLARIWLIPIKKVFRPRLGVLYHHKPKPLIIPKRYFHYSTLQKWPTISIVTPAFRHGNFIEATMKSVLDQHYASLEYIVKDGGSNDNTVDILQSYKGQLTYWESTKDSGQSQAINIGFSHTNGDIMAYLNSDDLLLPGALHYVAHYFHTHPEVDVVYGHRVLIDENGLEIGRWILPSHQDEILSWADYVPQETLFWRRSLWEKVGGKIDESFQFAMDWDLLLRFREASAKIVRLPRFLGAFRIHPHQKSSASISSIGVKEMQRLRERVHGRTVEMEEINENLKSFLNVHQRLHVLYYLNLLKY